MGSADAPADGAGHNTSGNNAGHNPSVYNTAREVTSGGVTSGEVTSGEVTSGEDTSGEHASGGDASSENVPSENVPWRDSPDHDAAGDQTLSAPALDDASTAQVLSSSTADHSSLTPLPVAEPVTLAAQEAHGASSLAQADIFEPPSLPDVIVAPLTFPATRGRATSAGATAVPQPVVPQPVVTQPVVPQAVVPSKPVRSDADDETTDDGEWSTPTLVSAPPSAVGVVEAGETASPVSGGRASRPLSINPFDPEANLWRPMLRSGALLAAAVVVALLIGLSAIILAGRNRHFSADAGYLSPTSAAGAARSAALPTATPRTLAARGEAVAWMQSNLDRSDAIAADSSAAALTRAGFTLVSVPKDGRDLPDNIRYVVTRTPSAPPALQALLKKAVPVAAFGSGSDAITVSQVESAGAKSLARMVSTNREARAAAGRQLSLNSRLSVAAKARAAFERASIDLRAQTLLALLTQNGDVRLDAAPQSSAERRAQVPIRTVVVTVDDVTMARHTIDTLPPLYRARSTQLAKRSQLTVQFPVQGVPAMPVS